MGPETTSAAASTSTAVVRSSSSSSALLQKQQKKPIASSSTSLAPGFRFHPTDEELIIYYLKRKICSKPFRYDVITDVDIYKTEPWFLAEKSKLKSRDQEWYFFSLLDRKYANGARMNRATGEGYWKATGNDRVVRHDSQPVGLKKTLVFHFGRAPEGKRTNWVMHEYRLIETELEKCGDIKDAYVLCRVFHKANMGPPTGNRYAPFIEEEWDDSTTVIPGEETREEMTNGIKDNEKDIVLPHPPSKALREELPSKTRYLLAVCKSERLSDSRETCMTDDEATPPPESKRKKIIDLNLTDSTGSESSPKIANGSSSSAATSATDSTSRLSTLVEYSLMESCRIPQSASDSTNINSSMPPECFDFINSLQEEIYRVTVDREKLRLDMLHLRSMLNSLQAQLARLSKENSSLRKKLQGNTTSKTEDAETKRKANPVTVDSET